MHLIAREDAARMLGISLQEMKRKQAAGQVIVAERGKRGAVFYNRQHIIALNLRRNEGKTAAVSGELLIEMSFSAEEGALVLPELRKGLSLIDCAIACPSVHPSKIRAIASEYERLAGSILLDAASVAAINELPLDGTFPITKASDVVELLKESAGGAPCAICAKSPRHLCKGCAIPFVRRQLAREARAEKKATAVPDEAAAVDD